MAQRVQLIFTENPGGLPATYQLPPGLDLELASVVARINGAAASDTFIPVLEALSSDDKVMARVRIDQEFAVGDTGVVTFAPFLRRAPTSSGAGAPLQALKGSSSTNIGAGSTTVAYVSTSDTRSDGTYFNFTGGNLRILAPGVYLLGWESRSWTTNPAAACRVDFSAVVVSGSTSGWIIGQFPTDSIFSLYGVLLPNLGPAAADMELQPNPDGIAVLALDSTYTYPVEIQTDYGYSEDGASVANTTPLFVLGVIRLGDCFE